MNCSIMLNISLYELVAGRWTMKNIKHFSCISVLVSNTAYLYLQIFNNATSITVVILHLKLYIYDRSLEDWEETAVWSVLQFYTNIHLSVSCIWEVTDMTLSQGLDILKQWQMPLFQCLTVVTISELWLWSYSLLACSLVDVHRYFRFSP
jgi:hypothetical protein